MPRYKMKVIVEADKKTSSGIVYSRDCLESAVNDLNERLKEGTILGQIGKRTITRIDLRDASHTLKSIALNDKGEIWADIETLPTRNGKIVDKCIDNVAATVDGYGEIDENGEVKKFEIIRVNLIPKQ